jgi:short-subunit dehydrogenase
MKKLLIVGGSKGIGKSILENALNEFECINISRTEPQVVHDNLTHYSIDVLNDDLPELDEVDALVFCPG